MDNNAPDKFKIDFLLTGIVDNFGPSIYFNRSFKENNEIGLLSN
jgi:hypothetical protein